MKTCPKCGASLSDEARFCLYCMTSLDEKEPAGGFAVRPLRARIAMLLLAAALVLGGIGWGIAALLAVQTSPAVAAAAPASAAASSRAASEASRSQTPSSAAASSRAASSAVAAAPQASRPSSGALTGTIGYAVIVDEGKSGDCVYTLEDNGHLTVSGEGAMKDYGLLGGPWGNEVTSVTVEDGVTDIGKCAFANCRSLTSVTLPDSLKSISEDAFSLCTSLTSVTIPDSVTTVGKEAFYGCSSLASVTLGDYVIIIDAYAFADCTALAKVTFGHADTVIGQYAFHRCTALTSVTLSDSVQSIGVSAFLNSGLARIVIPASVTSIGYNAIPTGATIVTTRGSYAKTYAKANGIEYEYLDG